MGHGPYERGYCRDHATIIVPKGAITEQQFGELCRYMLKHHTARGREQWTGMVFQYAFAFRPGHVGMVSRNDFKLNTSQLWEFYGRNDKRKAKDPEHVRHESMTSLQGIIDKFLELFPAYDPEFVGTMIKEASKAGKWSKHVQWNGAHCLRHGSISAAWQEGGLEAAKRRGGHFTDEMASDYGFTTEQRIAIQRQPKRGTKARWSVRARKPAGSGRTKATATARAVSDDGAPGAATARPKKAQKPRPKRAARKATATRAKHKPAGKKPQPRRLH